MSQGSSQSGRFIRTFIHLGFNQDEAGRIVWDGAIPHIAAGQMPLNVRFALPDGASYPYEIDNDGVMWWGDFPDKLRSRKSAGLLDRCRTTKTCPKIMEEFGSTEFWDLRMSPVLVGTNAKQDLPQPENVRSYYFPGTTHGGGPGGFSAATPAAARGRAGVCEFPANPNPESDTMRALLEDMVDWVRKHGASGEPISAAERRYAGAGDESGGGIPRTAHGETYRTISKIRCSTTNGDGAFTMTICQASSRKFRPRRSR